MEADRIESSSSSKSLSTLYPNYFGAWRAVAGVPSASAPATPIEEREQRWEGEGGSCRNDA